MPTILSRIDRCHVQAEDIEREKKEKDTQGERASVRTTHLGNMTRSGLVIHEMKNVEGVEEEAEPVVAHGKDLVLRRFQQDPGADPYI